MRKLAASLCCLFLVPVVVAGAALGGASITVSDGATLADIPSGYGALYLAAARAHGFDWQLLAAVGKVECDHGRGDCHRPNSAGAMGPMQFMPATWEAYKAASGDPPYDVYDARDAIFAAAAKLSSDGIATRPRDALFSYNHSSAYVDLVISWAVRYGWIGVGGDTLAAAVASHPAIELRADARADVVAGLVDTRVLGALLYLAASHRLSAVGPFVTGHSVFVAGTTRVSNHAVGRAVDIPVVDGLAVSYSNSGAREAALSLLELPVPLRPHELGSPWELSSTLVVTFTKDHSDHIHIGYGASS